MRKVTIRNDWENYIYYVDGSIINPKEIKTIFDKYGDEYEVEHRTESKTYNDMGHTYTSDRIVLDVNLPLGRITLRENSKFYIK